jgi:sulfonate transport system ATP-binding protein
VLSIEGLTARYGSSTILNSIDLSLDPGERLAVLGPSGIGKTTLLRCIKGLMSFSGKISWRGSPLRKEDSAVAMVYQDLRLFPWLKAADNIELPLKIAGVRRDERRERREEQLARVGLPDKGGRYPKELSGGEAQRVALARTLITRPELLLLDEPFSSLDAMTREVLQALLLRRVLDEGLSLLLVTHSIDEAVFMAERIIFIHPEKKILEILTSPRENPFSREDRLLPADQLTVRHELQRYYAD